MNNKWRSDNPPYYLSAYALACKRGFEGTIDEWLLSLTAYGLAVKKGFKGTQEEWLASIQGKSAYQYAVEAGYKGTEEGFGDRLNQQGKTAYEYAIEGGFVGTIEDFRKKLAAEYLLKTGGTMSGDIAMDGHKVTGLGTPTEPGDAVSKSAMEKALEELTGGSIPVSVENGGTGATSAADARTNLGAVNKAGDTMTGRLILPTLRMNPDSNFPTLEIYSGGSLIATLNWNKNTRRTQIVNYSPNTDYREIFASPAADSDLAEDQYYELLTSKIPVTVAQGGTGASTAAGARENLGVSGALKLTAVWTNSSPESSFAAQTVALSGASGLDMAFWIVEYRGLASDTGSVLNTIAFPGHGTVSHYHNESKIMGRSVEFSGTSAVFKDCYTGTTVDNTCLVPYRICAVHRA
ncbi:MAG: hypothetical protein ACI3V4_02490 [Faecousia sp.]